MVRSKSPETRGRHRAARLAHSRYGVSAAAVLAALRESERAFAEGGLASLGNILHQGGLLGLGAAMDLNRIEAPLAAGRRPTRGAALCRSA